MNFVRNFVSGIPRVNLHTKNFMEFSTVIPKIEKNNKEKKDSKKNKDKQFNKENINIDKLDNEYLTLKSIEHAYNN
jgi:hypothetical protein